MLEIKQKFITERLASICETDLYDCPGFAITKETLYSVDRPALLVQNKPRNLSAQ